MDSHLGQNILLFARTLRAAGLPIGSDQVIRSIEAVKATGIGGRDDFYWTLHAVLIQRREQREIFDQAFHIFWKNPQLLRQMAAVPLPNDNAREEAPPQLAEPLQDGLATKGVELPPDSEASETEAAMTVPDREILRHMDFEKMSDAELAEAKRAIAGLRLPIMDVPTRRHAPDPRGRRIDMRATLRASLRNAGAILLKRKSPKRRRPPLVILCDISGSMSRYSRLALHFVHAVTNDRDRVQTFLFGTRLTNITRDLRLRDVDVALDRVTHRVKDWSGGTHIGTCLHEFNVKWSRRVLTQGAVILLITDGLDREGATGLTKEMERLHKSCRRLIWLNPLLRYPAYRPQSQGAKAMLLHVDDFRPIHSLESMQDLADALRTANLRDVRRPPQRPARMA